MITNVIETRRKEEKLRKVLSSLGSVLIAYSGGADSAYLAYMAHNVLGNNMLAIIADSASLPRRHLREALIFAEEHGIPVKTCDTLELEKAEYVRNDAMRCFHCKSELFTVMEKLRDQMGFRNLAFGMNIDDLGEFRPGQKAARERAVLAPLVDVNLTKKEIRFLARESNLAVWDKPAAACLSSRIEFGRPVTASVLSQVEAGEDILYRWGLKQFRVRHHGDLARIEVSKEELEKVLSVAQMELLSKEFKGLGYKFVTLDCDGYRTGSMNMSLKETAK